MSKIIINNPGKRGVWCRALTDREGTNVFSTKNFSKIEILSFNTLLKDQDLVELIGNQVKSQLNWNTTVKQLNQITFNRFFKGKYAIWAWMYWIDEQIPFEPNE